MMRLQVIDSASSPAASVNEDGLVALEDELWVFDGATGLAEVSLMRGATDAAWLVDQAIEVASAASGGGLLVSLAGMVARLNSDLPAGRPPHQVPSASLAAVRLRDDTLEVVTLGDCRLIIRHPGRPALSIDDAERLDALDRAAIERLVAARRQHGGDLSRARARIENLLRDNRDLLNQPDGYQALAPGLDTSAIKVHDVTVSAGTVGLLVSDGYFRLVDTFAHVDLEGLLDRTGELGAGAMIEELRRLEADDPEGERAPRLKRSDDATAVLFAVVDET